MPVGLLDHETELVGIAESSAPGQLSKALAAWTLGHDSDEQRDRREREDTYLSSRVEPDGMGSIRIRLPVIAMSRVQAAVDARVMQSRRRDPEHPNPSLGYQRAHALLDLLGCTDAPARLESPRATVDTEIIVHVRSDGCSMHDGTPIADNAVGSLLDESFIRVLIHDAENRPVNASTRRRHPTTRQTGHTHTDELFRRCPRCHTRRHQQQGQ